jgi:nitroreductase
MPTDPRLSNSVLQAIEARRSIGRLSTERPSRAQVEAILTAALYAPNHHSTHPWRFVVLASDARRTAGEALAASLDRRAADAGSTIDASTRANEAAKFLRAPVVIVVAVEPTPGEPIDEEVAAGAAAVQNMLLAAHSLGLATTWRTGATVRDPLAAADFGFSPRAVLIGFVYLGIPDQAVPPKPRPPRPVLSTVSRWDGWIE